MDALNEKRTSHSQKLLLKVNDYDFCDMKHLKPESPKGGRTRTTSPKYVK